MVPLRLYVILSMAMGLLASACQQRMACPSYHSYFILDISETKNQFSLFGPDSLPRKEWDVDKQKVGIAEVVTASNKWSDINIIPMESVYKPLEDPFEQFQTTYAESDTVVQVDSLAVISDYYNDFENVDQMIYLYHFGKYINRRNIDALDPKEELEEDEPLIDADDVEEPAVDEKKGIWPFGKKRRKKTEDQPVEDSQ